MLGHASAAMTLDAYADLFDDDLDAVAERLTRTSVGEMWANGDPAPFTVRPTSASHQERTHPVSRRRAWDSNPA